MILIPQKLIEVVFGNPVIIGLILIALIACFIRRAHNSDWIDEAENKHKTRFEYLNGPIIEAAKARREKEEKDRQQAELLERYRINREDMPTAYEEWLKENHPEYESINGKWSPTGWYFNGKTGKWEPPDYLSKESSQKWRWDEEKRIWINIEKEKRMERYRKNREGKPPTYEEWKAAKLAEQKEEAADCTNDK